MDDPPTGRAPANPAAPWFRPPARIGRARLFCFPFAGGNAMSFQPWHETLGPDVELWVAEPPGRGTRWTEPPLHDVDELAGELAGAVEALGGRPFAFFGHSVGALLAFEVARTLRRRGRVLPGSLWVSGAEGPRARG